MQNLKKLLVVVVALFVPFVCAQCPCRCKCNARQKLPQKSSVKQNLKKVYSKTACQGDNCNFGGRACACSARIAEDIGYTREELDKLADANLGLGCGNPINLGEIKAGQTILDLGSGAGLDCFLAAQKVGLSGKVIGVDMTAAMIKKATDNAQRYGYSNVEFRQGDIEHLPLENNSVDIIISNCVLSLTVDKAQAFHEAYRVLKPGGKMYVSDIVLLKSLSDKQKNDERLSGTCVLGALSRDHYLYIVKQVGFTVDILDEDFDVNKKKFNNDSLPISSLKYIACKK